MELPDDVTKIIGTPELARDWAINDKNTVERNMNKFFRLASDRYTRFQAKYSPDFTSAAKYSADFTSTVDGKSKTKDFTLKFKLDKTTKKLQDKRYDGRSLVNNL